MTLIYIVAGEASGDVLGARLLAALRAREPALDFAGIGGERLAAAGMPSLFPIRELALMGLVEVLPNIRRLARRLAETTADIAARRPAVIVTIDSPGFTLRLAKRVRPLGIPIIHYVAPQIWAWRPWRVREIATLVDEVLCLLPFEPILFERAGIAARFVGHPVLESGVDAGDAARFWATHGITADQRVLIVMPGSRGGEIKRLLPVFGEAIALLAARNPELRPVLPVSAVVAEKVRAGLATWPLRPILVTDIAEKHDAFAAAAAGGAGLIKSGTSTLEMAVAGVPHLIAYKVHPITAEIIRHLARVPFASLVNLLVERGVVPELMQTAVTAEALAATLQPLLSDPEAIATQRGGFAEALAHLRPPEGLPSAAAAAAVLARLG
jgi:lipid-A-disaccharide synthase